MPIPRVAIPKHKVSENDRKLHALENTLYDMGYNCEEPKDMVKVIEKRVERVCHAETQ